LIQIKFKSFEAIEEINIHGRLESPYIVKYYDSFIDEEGCVNIVLEYWNEGDLHTYLEKKKEYLSEDEVWKLFIQITFGLHYLHSSKILHRDLKSLNIFLANGKKIKIGDLGSASENSEDNGTDGKIFYATLIL